MLQRSLYDAIEYSLLGFYLSLLYKETILGLLLVLVLSACGLLVDPTRNYVLKPVAILGIVYVFLAMGTAFLVSFNDGAYRTAQFLLVLFASLAATKFLCWADQYRWERFFRRFTIVTFLVFLHLVIYHIVNGHITTWKYLYDTKTVISICAVLLFLNEDAIVRRVGYAGWILGMAFYAGLVLLSGERKAYLLFVVLFLFSRTPLVLKTAIGALAAALLTVYMLAAPADDYVARQVGSAFKSEHQLHISEFYAIEAIADQSDLIREFVNRNAWQLFLENPITGVGATGYLAWARDTFGTLSESRGLSMNVHGEPNRLPAEEGLIGIVVACALLLALISVIVLHLRMRGWSQTPSSQRGPLFAFCFLFLYAAFEASDTFMLTMILLYALEMGRTHDRNLWKLRGGPNSVSEVGRTIATMPGPALS